MTNILYIGEGAPYGFAELAADLLSSPERNLAATATCDVAGAVEKFARGEADIAVCYWGGTIHSNRHSAGFLELMAGRGMSAPIIVIVNSERDWKKNARTGVGMDSFYLEKVFLDGTGIGEALRNKVRPLAVKLARRGFAQVQGGLTEPAKTAAVEPAPAPAQAPKSAPAHLKIVR